jgi:hypothetical protein
VVEHFTAHHQLHQKQAACSSTQAQSNQSQKPDTCGRQIKVSCNETAIEQTAFMQHT